MRACAHSVYVALLVACAASPVLQAQTIRPNRGFSSQLLARNDDGSTPLQSLGFTIDFFGNRRSMAYVNNNGNITFDAALATFTPFGLTNTQREIIAPFFGDVDTRGLSSALVAYGQDTVDGRKAFGVNYIDVGYFASHSDKTNSFQLVLIDRSDTGDGNVDIEFNYARIRWETGDASGGSNGFGGTPAAAGWSNGTGNPGTSFELQGSLISGAFLDGGSRSLVRNRLNSSARGRYVFRARNGSILPPLTILTGAALPNGTVGIPYTFQLSSVGGLAPFRWTMQVDPGATAASLNLSADGMVSGTPATAGTYFFTVSHTARSEEGEETVTRRLSVTVDPPVLRITSACPLPPGTVTRPYFSAFQASGSPGPFTWSYTDVSSRVPGLSLTPNGQLSGVPTTPGNYFFTVRVSSGEASSATPASRSCSLTINAPVLDLTSSCELPPATRAVPYSQYLVVSGGRLPYTWSIHGGLPQGMSLQRDGAIAGAANVSGTFLFNVTVTDGNGEPSSQSCTLSVNEPTLALSTGCPLPAAATGVPYSHSLLAAGGSSPYRWSVLGALPGGLELTPDGLLKGAPYSAGPFLFRLLSSDSAGNSAVHPCSLVVTRSPLSLSSCPLPSGRAGVAYSRLLSVVGGASPYTFSAQGPLPDGLSLTLNGLLRGTPARAGFFPLSVAITDGSGRTQSQFCALAVDAPPLRLSTACPLPAARLGQSYSHSIAASGGLEPLRYSALGRMPAGLTLDENGRLAGTPSEKGNFPFTIHASDAQAQAIASECSISVTLSDLPEIRISDMAPSFDPASTGPTLGIELSRAYSLPIDGVLNLSVAADTGSYEIQIDRPDPRLRFANTQRSVRFTIPSGTLGVRFPLSTTGTVASAATVSVTSLEVLGNKIIGMPGAKRFRVQRTPPVVSSACYVATPSGVELVLSGYTPTRELTNAAITFSRAPLQNAVVDVSIAGAEWFTTDEAVRHGGAFILTLPLEFAGKVADLGDVTVTIENRHGVGGSRAVARCQ